MQFHKLLCTYCPEMSPSSMSTFFYYFPQMSRSLNIFTVSILYLYWREKTLSEKPRLKIFMYMLPLFKWVVLYSLPDAWSGLQATFCPATHLYFQQYTLVFQTKSTKYKMEKSTNADKRGYLLMKQFIKIF